MTDYIHQSGLQISPLMMAFIADEALPETGLSPVDFWQKFAKIVAEFSPQNRALLIKRADIQQQINDWHLSDSDEPYEEFLARIGYLVPTGPDFSIETNNIDPEIASIAGPQLVVPITNARFALNAANARWGSLFDGLYGTDALGDFPKKGGFDAERGGRVVAWAKGHLDKAVPLAGCNWAEVTGINLDNDVLIFTDKSGDTGLADPSQFMGYSEDLSELVFKKNGLHIRVCINKNHPMGKIDPAGICDVILESAVSVIIDCEDSVATVDAEDKVLAYSNWLGLMKGDLSAEISKAGKTSTRRAAQDLEFSTVNGGVLRLKGRALMLVRNVGHLMTNPAILDQNGAEIPEGLMDAMITTLIAMHDLKKTDGPRNSVHGSVYVVKPKMHGPEEVAFSDAVFTAVEAALDLPQYTVKLGIMDEERRTSVNLKECIRAAKHRVAFINTGFLDRTGDEIHTSMMAGPMVRKSEMKHQKWIMAYEDNNVDMGLACGLQGKAQIGKGMWAMPDLMMDMLEQKVGHLKAGANCAWVPSPTAATLHATHYHQLDVFAQQNRIKSAGLRSSLTDLLTIPLAGGQNWSYSDIMAELENNAQGILGYVVRWIDQGVGCSKVPDIHDVGLMEDRATCRISSQHMANWLYHAVVDKAEIQDVMKRMAVVVDGQNADDPTYKPMAPDYDGIAFQAALDLVLKGTKQPSGYTEPLLHKGRLALKAG